MAICAVCTATAHDGHPLCPTCGATLRPVEPEGYGIVYDGDVYEPRPRPTVEVLIKTYRRRGCAITVTEEDARDLITIDRVRIEPAHRYLTLYTPPGAAADLTKEP